MSNKLDGVKVTLGPVRYSFVNIFEKQQFKNGGDAQYSLRALIDQDDEKNVQKMQKAIKAAKEEGKNKLWGGVMPKDLNTTVHDGNNTGREEEEGMWCLNTNNKNRKPHAAVGKDRIPGTKDNIKSGDYGLICVTFKAYDWGQKGVSCFLNSVWKTKNGEPLAGGSSFEDDFKDVDENAIDFDDMNVEIDPLTGQPIGSDDSEDYEDVPF